MRTLYGNYDLIMMENKGGNLGGAIFDKYFVPIEPVGP
jgi:hypothetical protein